MKLAAFLFSLCLLASAQGSDFQIGPPFDIPTPNVLLVVKDDVAERDIDSIPTPTFDALAEQGLRFRRAYSNPLCSATRRSLLFGVDHTAISGLPCSPGTYDPESEPLPGAPSLGLAFSLAGYRTAFFGKWHLGSGPGPWELAPTYHGHETWRAGIYANVGGCAGAQGTYLDWRRAEQGTSFQASKYQTWAVRDSFLSWLGELAPSDRWFAVLSFQAAHGPFTIPPNQTCQGCTNRQRYRRVLIEADAALGVVLASIDLEETLVVVLGDNGTPIQATSPTQDPTKAKGTTYEDGIRVPMVWAGPLVPIGETESIVSVVDLLPTFSEWLDIPLPSTDGVSLLPILADPGAEPRGHAFAGNTRQDDEDFAVVDSRWKYREDHGAPFLFDLDADPLEETNLAADPNYSSIRAELEALLEAHVSGL